MPPDDVVNMRNVLGHPATVGGWLLFMARPLPGERKALDLLIPVIANPAAGLSRKVLLNRRQTIMELLGNICLE